MWISSSSSSSKLLGGTGGAKGGIESTKKHEETYGDSGQVLYLDCGDSLMSAVFVKTWEDNGKRDILRLTAVQEV